MSFETKKKKKNRQKKTKTKKCFAIGNPLKAFKNVVIIELFIVLTSERGC